MVELIKLELYKFIKSKKNLMIISILFVYIIGIIGYNQLQSKQYMDERGKHFTDSSKFSTSLSSTLESTFENRILNGEDPEFIQKRIDYYALEGRNLQVLGFFYNQNKAKDYKYMNKVINNLYSSMINGYDEGIISLEEIEKRGYTLRELKLVADYTQYLVDEDIQPLMNVYKIDGANGMKLFLIGENLIVLFILLALLIADIYLKEMSQGSYKLLLTQPNKRKKIYLSKIGAVLCVSLVLIFASALVNLLICSLIGGIGDWSYPLMSRISLNMLTVNGMNEPMLILPLWEFVLRGFIILLPLIIFTVIFAFTISILTDSNSKTLGIIIIILSASFALNAFLDKGSAMNLWYPHSYLFVQNVLEVNNRSNYLIGIIICSFGAILSFIAAYIRFVKKDFLGAVD